MFGFYRVATAVPRLQVADVPFNTKEIIALMKQGAENKASVLLFPELCITGYTWATFSTSHIFWTVRKMLCLI